MDAAARARITAVVGAKGVDGAVVTPADAAQAAEVLRACSDAGIPVTVRSSGGGTAPDGGIVLSLRRLDEVAVDPGATVLRAGAGATAGTVRAAATAAGLAAPALGPDDDVSVGSLVAGGRVARRALTGIEALLPSGERVGTSAGVLKDVAAYDLAGVLLGSAGRLAAIVSVGLRLRPAAVAAEPGATPAGMAETSPVEAALRSAFDPAGLLRAAG